MHLLWAVPLFCPWADNFQRTDIWKNSSSEEQQDNFMMMAWHHVDRCLRSYITCFCHISHNVGIVTVAALLAAFSPFQHSFFSHWCQMTLHCQHNAKYVCLLSGVMADLADPWQGASMRGGITTCWENYHILSRVWWWRIVYPQVCWWLV